MGTAADGSPLESQAQAAPQASRASLPLPASVKKMFLWRRGPLGNISFESTKSEPGEQFCYSIAWLELAQKECFLHRCRHNIYIYIYIYV